MARPALPLRWLPLLAIPLAACTKSGSDATQSAAPPAAPPEDAAPKEPPEEPPFARVEGERGLRSRLPGTHDGLTLISPLRSKSVHLVDMDGKVVHTWNTNHVPAGGAYFLPNGHLLRTAMVENNPRFHGGGIGGRIEELDWDGKLVWEYELATDQRTTHHDISRLPNGNILAIAWEYHSPEEAFARGRDTKRIHEEGLWADVVIEIKPILPSGGEIVWTWRTWDHLVQDFAERAEGYGRPADFSGRIDINADHRYDDPETDEERKEREEREAQMHALGYGGGASDAGKDAKDGKAPPPKPQEKYKADWLHTNSIEYQPELDLIALSIPHLCEVVVIDHGTTTQEAAGSTGGKRGKGGELLYRYGNARNYGMGDESSRKLYYQHNATWLPGAQPGRYGMLLFNNGSGRPKPEFSSVEALLLPFDPQRGFVREEGQPFGPTEPVWSYQDPGTLFSPFISGAQRLPNGNTMVCEGARGRVLEVTPQGAVVWDYYNPHGGEIEPAEQAGKAPPKALFRAERIPKSHPGLAGHI